MLKSAECATRASECKNAEKMRVRVRICAHLLFGLSLSDCQFEEREKQNYRSRFATSRPELAFFHLCSRRVADKLEVVRIRSVAMSAMSKNPTTMTTALHRELQEDWSSLPFSTVRLVCAQGVLWSSLCCCLLLDCTTVC